MDTNDNKYITYSIKEVRIVNAKNKATYTLMTATPDNGGKWTEPSEKATYTYKFSPITLNEANTTATLTATDGGAMLIPQTITPWNGKKVTETDGVSDYDGGAYISLLLNVKHTDGNFIYPTNAAGGNSYGWVAVPLPTGTKWDKSNKYIYTLNLSTGCGKVDPIDPGTSVDPSSPTNPTGKDPGKGENVFGNVIKFDVTVLPWTDKNGVANGEATYDPNENIQM